MKYSLVLFLCLAALACNSLFPYKGQSLDDLLRVVQTPEKYQGNIVSFSGEIRGILEDIHTIKLVLKVEVPLYYYATGKDPLSYQFLLVNFKKEQPHASGLSVGNPLKVLARIDHPETRTNAFGSSVCVLYLEAIALADRTHKQDFFHAFSPDKQLYESWKAGRLFFKETPQQILSTLPAPTVNTTQKSKQKPVSVPRADKSSPQKQEILFDEEESFVLFEP